MTPADDVPDVSVVLPVKDARATLPQALDALKGQRTACTWELLVVDDGSRDGSGELARARLQGMENARVVVNTRSPGAAGARNAGILASRGAVVAFCDADDRVGEGWVQAAWDAARGGGAFSGLCRELLEPFDPDAPVINPSGVFHNAFGAAFRTCNAAVERSLLLGVGGFDESLGRYGHEDSELCARLTEAGSPIGAAPDMVVYFRETTRSVQQVRKVWQLANAEYVYWARHPERFDGMFDARLHVHQVLGFVPYYVTVLRRRESISASAVVRDGVTRVGRLRAALRWQRAGGPPAPFLLDRAVADLPPSDGSVRPQ